MSRFTDSASTSYSLSITAMEEASRVGQREADIDHLFLALTVSEQTAGQVLRSLGITIDDAREAVAAQHAEQLAGLGIRMDPPEPGRIVFHETEGY
ncbi:Clp protease, partial [Geobacillus sp. MMMUD3]|nr:Clp protease [Geobacillus sp. MMMUD3]